MILPPIHLVACVGVWSGITTCLHETDELRRFEHGGYCVLPSLSELGLLYDVLEAGAHLPRSRAVVHAEVELLTANSACGGATTYRGAACYYKLTIQDVN